MTYGREALLTGQAVVTAVAEPRPTARAAAAAEFGVADGHGVADWRELVALPDLDVDAVVIATPDRQHTEPALAFLDLGLPLLLEKPMAPTEEEARRIVEARRAAGVIVCVAHVLRYSPYTQVVKEVVDSGAIGDVVSVEHLEPVGWWHQAHSFVRGNWRREDESSPMLLAKCCHDVDWLSHVVGRPAVRVSSFGSLSHFTPGQPPGRCRPHRCLDCAVEPDCPYSAKKIYLDHVARTGGPALAAVGPGGRGQRADRSPRRCARDRTGAASTAATTTWSTTRSSTSSTPGGVTASLTMTAFTPMGFRRTRIFGTRGTLEGDGYSVDVFDFLTGSDDLDAGGGPDRPAGGRGAPGRRHRAHAELPRGRTDPRPEPGPDLAGGEPAHPRDGLGRRAGPTPGHRRAGPFLTAAAPPGGVRGHPAHGAAGLVSTIIPTT